MPAVLSTPAASSAPVKKIKVAVDGVFFKRLRLLLGMIFPNGVRSKEAGMLLLHTGLLIARTIISILVAGLDGKLVRLIVERNPSVFALYILRWLAIGVVATGCNSLISFMENKLGLAFRTRLVDFLYKKYMANGVYYKVGNLDSRMSNPDQCLTSDVNDFCSQLARLYSQLSKPLLDVVLMTAQLVMLHKSRGNISATAPMTLAFGCVAFTGLILRIATPPFGRLVADQAKLEGDLRAAHSRIITHAEEIAFYKGENIELNSLQRCYLALVRHMNNFYKVRVPYTMLEQWLMRYLWGCCGL